MKQRDGCLMLESYVIATNGNLRPFISRQRYARGVVVNPANDIDESGVFGGYLHLRSNV